MQLPFVKERNLQIDFVSLSKTSLTLYNALGIDDLSPKNTVETSLKSVNRETDLLIFFQK